jgi:hypothetical protein
MVHRAKDVPLATARQQSPHRAECSDCARDAVSRTDPSPMLSLPSLSVCYGFAPLCVRCVPLCAALLCVWGGGCVAKGATARWARCRHGRTAKGEKRRAGKRTTQTNNATHTRREGACVCVHGIIRDALASTSGIETRPEKMKDKSNAQRARCESKSAKSAWSGVQAARGCSPRPKGAARGIAPRS